MEALREATNEYVRVHKQIVAASKELAAVRKQKAELGAVILSVLEQNNIDQVNPKDSDLQLIRRESNRTEGLKPDLIASVLRENGLDVEKILNDINNRRIKTTKAVLSCKKLKK